MPYQALMRFDSWEHDHFEKNIRIWKEELGRQHAREPRDWPLIARTQGYLADAIQDLQCYENPEYAAYLMAKRDRRPLGEKD